jgi:hypothetical protein
LPKLAAGANWFGCAVEQIPGGYKVKDANGQSLAYADADIAHVLTMDEARRITAHRQVTKATGQR